MNRDQIEANVLQDAVYRFLPDNEGGLDKLKDELVGLTPAEMAKWFMDNLDFLAPKLQDYVGGK